MFQGVIEKRVMMAVKAKIKELQKKYEDGVVELEEKLEKDKTSLADSLVGEIINKVI